MWGWSCYGRLGIKGRVTILFRVGLSYSGVGIKAELQYSLGRFGEIVGSYVCI